MDDCRLYLLTPPRIDDIAAFARAFEQALSGGDVAGLQIRLKDADGPAPDDHALSVAARLLEVARGAGVALLMNDRPDLAVRVGADGVHLGQADGSVAAARKLLGDEATIGATCHASTHLGLLAGEEGADYVAFGAFFPTQTKSAPTRAEPDILAWWRHATTLPSVAIGGITPDNCAPLVAAGADFIAASSAVWSNPAGPGAAVKAFNQAIAHALQDRTE